MQPAAGATGHKTGALVALIKLCCPSRGLVLVGGLASIIALVVIGAEVIVPVLDAAVASTGFMTLDVVTGVRDIIVGVVTGTVGFCTTVLGITVVVAGVASLVVWILVVWPDVTGADGLATLGAGVIDLVTAAGTGFVTLDAVTAATGFNLLYFASLVSGVTLKLEHQLPLANNKITNIHINLPPDYQQALY